MTALCSLLSCFRDETEDPYVVRIFLCPDLKQPVASIQQIRWHPNYARWGMEKPIWRPLDIQAPYQPKDHDDIVDAAQILWPNISTAITNGNFSYSKSLKSYLKFDDNDRLFITEALTYDKDNQL